MYRIDSKESWWGVVDTYWDEIVEFMAAIGINISSNIWYDGTAMDHSISDELKYLKEHRDTYKMYMVMNKIWGHAPDKRWIHSYRGFGIVCDLCSEMCPEYYEE